VALVTEYKGFLNGMMINNILPLLSGVVVGIILFQTAVVAPTVFKGLGADNAGPFLRQVFPKFFAILMMVGIVKVILATAVADVPEIWVAGSTFLLAGLSYRLIPKTNKARDEGNESVFKKLHFASVLMTVIMLIMNAGSIAL
tara:strand:- start:7491 stop:7919 length:429 start_codon:yes stop_codon:yes gene_type:complete